ncbi:MAG TPA: M20/M25/M40 family metallo-hydrolase [Thermomicrobiales bacterium]|nr:M20/M25/M40 family metallo-hydrolase [Thermomicrobiales bacterium]
MYEFERADVIEAASELVRIPSVNPDLVPDGGGEGELAEAIAARLRRTPGIDVELQPVIDGRSNVIAAAGTGNGRTIMLNGHIDTVGVDGMAEPFSGRVEGNRLYGRGSYDMKAAMGGATLLLERIARAGDFPGRVVVTYVVDEEYASLGTEAVVRELDRWRPDAAIVLENSDLDICVAHKGFVWTEFVTQGVAAHGSRYWLGVDAIAMMGYIICELDQLGQQLLERHPHKYLGPPSLHMGLIRGGQEVSSYPAGCYLQVERRTVPGETVEMIEAEYDAILERLRQRDPDFSAMMTTGIVRNPFEVDEDEEIVCVLRDTITEVRGEEPTFIGKAGWADSALLAEAGIPTAYFGPAGFGAHGAEEWVDIDSLVAFTNILAKAVHRFCAGGE